MKYLVTNDIEVRIQWIKNGPRNLQSTQIFTKNYSPIIHYKAIYLTATLFDKNDEIHHFCMNKWQKFSL